MGKPYYFNRNYTRQGFRRKRLVVKDKFAEQYPYNEYIKFDELRVIDENGTNLGIKPREEALQIAKEKGLDLVVIAPNAQVPVAKLVDLNSFKYQLQKKEKLAKRSQKKNKIKEVKFSPLIAEGDLERKVMQAHKFVQKGYTVKVTVMRKRRVTKEMFDSFVNKLLTLLENCCTILNTQTKGRDTHILIKSKNAKDQKLENTK